jgi:hypothetical protein
MDISFQWLMRHARGIIFTGLLVFLEAAVASAHAYDFEPPYCNYETLKLSQIHVPSNSKGLFRLKGFHLGAVNIFGLAVGISLPKNIRALAQNFSRINKATRQPTANKNNNYCTWYFNRWNLVAEETFNWVYVPNPGTDFAESLLSYSQALDGLLTGTPSATSTSQQDFLSCLANTGFLAMGCNGQQHRGPTVFAMLLSYSGCSPENSVNIVHTLWGQNGIPYYTRLALADHAYKLGQQTAGRRLLMQKLLLQTQP